MEETLKAISEKKKPSGENLEDGNPYGPNHVVQFEGDSADVEDINLQSDNGNMDEEDDDMVEVIGDDIDFGSFVDVSIDEESNIPGTSNKLTIDMRMKMIVTAQPKLVHVPN
ncbi:hypothetical protein U1Q18_001532 [Sarracenia purpurea var. burkii]